MQPVPSVEHIWSPQRGEEGEGRGSTPQAEPQSGHAPSIPFTQSLFSDITSTDIGGRRSGGATTASAIANTKNNNNNNNSNSSGLMLSSPQPPRQSSPSYFKHALATGSGSSSPRDPVTSGSISSTPLFSRAVASAGDYSPTQNTSHRGGTGGGGGSISGYPGSSAAASNSNEDLFFQRDPLFLPRRNHTIGAGTTSNRRRLNTQFQFPRPGAPTSPGQNSLSAITGGRDIDDDEWEKMIKSRDDLVPGEDDREELSGTIDDDGASASSSAWRLDSSLFPASHRRFPSQPMSVQGTSPFMSGAHSPIASNARSHVNHQRSESAHVRSLEYGPFASAATITPPSSRYGNVDAGMIRRHQSLNHASGRAVASRLQGSRRNNNYSDSNKSDHQSPVTSIVNDRPLPPQSISPGPSFSVRTDRGELSSTPEGASTSTSTSLSSTLMDAHARLSRMSIQPNSDSQFLRESSVDSSSTAMPRDSESKKRLPSLVTNREVLQMSAAVNSQGRKEMMGPASAAAYVPPIGHAHHRRDSSSSVSPVATMSKSNLPNSDMTSKSSFLQGPFSAMPSSNSWGHQNNNLSMSGKGGLATAREEGPQDDVAPTWTDSSTTTQVLPQSIDNMALNIAILQQRLLQQQPQALAAVQLQQHQELHDSMHSAALFYGANNQPSSMGAMRQPQMTPYGPISTLPDMSNFRGYPSMANPPMPPMQGLPQSKPAPPPPAIDPALTALIAARGYNPPPSQFDLNPKNARFFVIKSFTEDDVQRSLKHEIWASTDKGNQRLDNAFKECRGEGGRPIYLFFSVNASGHFCGMAQMMTSLDYNSTSNVWVQEGKWKGTFKVRWIFVKDVPNVKLRHIKLTNTVEKKPVTQSRDTQELPVEGGKELLRIMAEYHSKTTLLQDWLFYEQQALQQKDSQSQAQQSSLFPMVPMGQQSFNNSS